MNTNYERFIASNQTLMTCFASVSADQYKGMSAADQAGVCKSEAAAVKAHIAAGHADFRNILAERMASLDAAQKWMYKQLSLIQTYW